PLLLHRAPRTPRYPLFPYTTLFRSHLGSAELVDRSCHIQQSYPQSIAGICRTLLELSRTRIPANLLIISRFLKLLGTPRNGDGRDRKSTRLNSSHVKISYAVFCLKK